MSLTGGTERSAARHTPGPWTVEDPLGPDILSIVAGDSPVSWLDIAQVSTEGEEIDPRTAVANAALIAAAPELADALVAVLEQWLSCEAMLNPQDYHANGMAGPLWAAARDALRKAGRLLPMLFFLLALPAAAQSLKGPARVIDGDTLEVAGQKVRLHGIDAPEKDQLCKRTSGAEYHCGAVSLVRLEELIGGRSVRCLGTERDRYKRLVARCYVVGDRGPALDLGGALVLRGLALAYRKYSLDYASAEGTARAARVGLWSGSFVPPEEWRKGVRR